jgi:hypothetical protein
MKGARRPIFFLYEDEKRIRVKHFLLLLSMTEMRKSSLCGITLPPSEMCETPIGGSQSMKPWRYRSFMYVGGDLYMPIFLRKNTSWKFCGTGVELVVC